MENIFYCHVFFNIFKGPLTFSTIVVVGPKVERNVVSLVQFFMVIPNLASDLPYVAFLAGNRPQSLAYQPSLRGWHSGCSGWIWVRSTVIACHWTCLSLCISSGKHKKIIFYRHKTRSLFFSFWRRIRWWPSFCPTMP